MLGAKSLLFILSSSLKYSTLGGLYLRNLGYCVDLKLAIQIETNAISHHYLSLLALEFWPKFVENIFHLN